MSAIPIIRNGVEVIKLDISGLDNLQKELDEAKNAIASLDGHLTTIRLTTADPLETQKAIHQIEAVIDNRIEKYSQNPLVKALADAAKDRFRQRILEQAAALRNQKTSSLIAPTKEKIDLNSPLELKRKQRFEFMNRLYEITNGSEMAIIDMWQIGKDLNLTRDETTLVTEYLKGEGLLRFRSLGGGIAITHLGVIEVESALQNPDKPTQHFPAVQNVIHIGTMTHSVIQQGNTNSSQVAQIESEERGGIERFLKGFAAQLQQLPLSEDEKSEVRAEISTAEAQLGSPKPKTQIIGACIKTLLSVLEKVGTSVLTSDVKAHLPIIHGFIGRLGL